jgi:glycerophosphoryl diester phosphodiesterase
MVERIHNNHKKIYAWTINDPDIVKTMLNVGVDSIITNDPIMVKNVIADYKDKNKVNVLFNFILSII